MCSMHLYLRWLLIYENLLLPFYMFFLFPSVSTFKSWWISILICSFPSLFKNILCLCFIFLSCGFHEVFVEHFIDKTVLFQLIIEIYLHLPIQLSLFFSCSSVFLLSLVILFYAVCYENVVFTVILTLFFF